MVHLSTLFVIPAKTFSRRVPDKNHREFKDGKSLTDIAIEAALSLKRDEDEVCLVSNIAKPSYKSIKVKEYPVADLTHAEVDSTLQIWAYACRNTHTSVTALLEPSSFPRNLGLLSAELSSFKGNTVIAVRLKHRYGLKAHVLVPTGEFYIATIASVLLGSCFDGEFKYVQSKSININSEEDFMEAQQ